MDGERLKNKPLSFPSSAGLSCQNVSSPSGTNSSRQPPLQPMLDLIQRAASHRLRGCHSPEPRHWRICRLQTLPCSLAQCWWHTVLLSTRSLPILPLGTLACVQCCSESVSPLPTKSLLSLPSGWTWLLHQSTPAQVRVNTLRPHRSPLHRPVADSKTLTMH